MTTALNVFDAFNAWHKRTPGKEADFKKSNPAAWDIVMSLLKEL